MVITTPPQSASQSPTSPTNTHVAIPGYNYLAATPITATAFTYPPHGVTPEHHARISYIPRDIITATGSAASFLTSARLVAPPTRLELTHANGNSLTGPAVMSPVLQCAAEQQHFVIHQQPINIRSNQQQQLPQHNAVALINSNSSNSNSSNGCSNSQRLSQQQQQPQQHQLQLQQQQQAAQSLLTLQEYPQESNGVDFGVIIKLE
ncbi:hypothetical protein HELRODRAFT_171485 [Helobdella robusta]|uniref:Uncharacterized protein n=1 Tax=Helobdella robusta TaxID=6412 RepID=T1F4C6_HELRO|nr:hypothetical protein HELRODRAFT_171485 [Helobdella robusta]ESO05153.1 hypothetical protein HELRODRAFT_171485 [Helobdella robusta]